MATPDLIKLAPTLSAEERYKLIVPDLHRTLMGEKCLISESERQSIIKFDKRVVWEEYTRNICILQWATTLWQRDIETERLRAFALSLNLSHTLERVLVDGDDKSISKEKRTGQFEKLKKYVAMLEEQSVEFYAYREAINKVEQELYGVPLFNEKEKNSIASCYEMVDELFEHNTSTIRVMCENKIIKNSIKPIVQDMESYLAKKPVPDPATIEQIVNEVREIADSETRMLGR